MFIVFLKFSDNKAQAMEFMDDHNAWLKQGFDDGVFLVAGSLKPNLGGTIVANSVSQEELKNRVNEDPFVKENVVTAEIFEIEPKKADERLQFLVG